MQTSSDRVRRKWWSFTLRELVLLMIAIAATLAWLRTQWHAGRPSPFANAFNAKEICHVAIASQRLIDGGGSGGSTRAGSLVSAHYQMGFSDPDAKVWDAIKEAESFVESRIHKAGGTIEGPSQSGNRVEVRYRFPGAVGFVQIIGFRDSATNQSILHVTLHEVGRERH